MKKRTFLVLALVAALALPTAAMAAAEFSLGGFIKLDAFWDSTQEGKNMNGPILRNNNTAPTTTSVNATSNFHHGRLKFTSQATRMNFTIKGPKLWGANTTGFIEMDFDAAETGISGAATSSSNSYTPRLRHGMFRMDWPETELIFGQYWSFFSQWFVETGQDGALQMTGTPTARLAQIRLSQKFLGAWKVGALVGEANGITNGQSYSANDHVGGESTEAPQVQIQGQYQQDLWGKAAWYGKPTPFTAQLTAGWQRGILQEQNYADTRVFGVTTGGAVTTTATGGADSRLMTTGQSNFNRITARVKHQYVDPWLVMGSFFIPVIPTHSANLAGTASLQTSWWMGQGVEAFGFTSFGSQVYRWRGVDATGRQIYEVDLMPRWGGQVQAQYYFTNQWFLTGVFGFSKAFGVGAFQTDANNPNNRRNAFFGDAVNYHQEYDICLWYRPVTAFKFGLQYSYNQTHFFQQVGQTGNGQANCTNVGEAHNVRFVGLFFF